MPRPWSTVLVFGGLGIAASLIALSPTPTVVAAVLAGLAGLAAMLSVAIQTLPARLRQPADVISTASPAEQWQPYSQKLLQSVPTQLPPPVSTFQGRAAELKLLLRRHEHWRRRRPAGTAGAPVVIFIHGMAGIGKSALAQSLAHRLRRQYPDGQLYANLGVAGTVVPPAQILHGFLSALGVDIQNIPQSTAERAFDFRKLTRNKRMLIFLDAARDQAQLRELIPSESQCTVIVTSRRDMSPAFGARSLQIRPLTLEDSVDMLAAVTGRRLAIAQPGCDPRQAFDLSAATAIARMCGSHPLALRAAADLVTQQRWTADLTTYPGDGHALTAVLQAPSRDLHDRLSSEYRLLSADHQHAFRLLPRVASRTFVPWVLRPICKVSLVEAENLLADLASAQLMLAAGRDAVTGIDRYELTPVARQFAMSLVTTNDDVAGAALRLDEAYLEAAERVIRELDPGFAAIRGPIADRWLSSDALFAARVAHQGQAKAWVREEYGNLLRAMRLAVGRGDHVLGTQIAAWLGGCVPRSVAVDDVLDGLNLAVQDAATVGFAAQVDVLLARGAYWCARGRFSTAFEDFAQALSLCHLGALASRRVLVERRCGEAHLRAGEYTAAARRFIRAERLARQHGDSSSMLPMIGILCYLAAPDAHAPPATELPPARESPVDDEFGYWTALARSDLAVEAGDWDAAEEVLAAAATTYDADLRRATTISYWQVRLHLARYMRKSGNTADVRHAIRAAYRSLHDHQVLADVAGQIRVHCLLVSAHAHLQQPETAAFHLDQARRLRNTVDPWLLQPGNPLDALLRRAQAEQNRAAGIGETTVHDLRQAASALAAHGDRRGVAEIAALTSDDLESLWRDAQPEIEATTAVRAYLDTRNPITLDQTATLRVELSAPHLRRYRRTITGTAIAVVICAGDADVQPPGSTVDLESVDDDLEFAYALRPRSHGPLNIKVQLYAPGDGMLLQQFDASLPPVIQTGQEAA
jgi:tetratricopeptide (TPR) repeat protein